jgi:glycosyltransferase involved in cell wall biosynthesis
VSVVHVVVPDGIDDPARPSGGYVYDRRVCGGLAASGWQVIEHVAPGSWLWPDPAAEDALAQLIANIADGSVVLIDGLIASTVPGILVPEADRLRLVALVHMFLGETPACHPAAHAQAREGAVLSAVEQVITTSSWTRERLLVRYALPPEKVHVAQPGVDVAQLASGTDRGGELLCVAAVAEHKGHDELLAALASIVDLPWRCVCVGTLHREPAFVERLRQRAEAAGISGRVCFAGPRIGDDLAQAYAAADVLVLASRAESYGMVVTEALARGLPVVATAVGGVPEALGQTTDGRRPGLLVPAGDSGALAAALRDWLGDAGLRQRLRDAARERRSTLPRWSEPTGRIAHVLTQAATS